MAKDPLIPKAPREGDSWESLASNLLGIDLHQPGSEDLVSEEELQALEVEPGAAEAGEPAPTPSSPPQKPAAESVNESAAAPSADAGGDVADDQPHPQRLQPESDASSPPSEEDSFWDPLASWEWDDEPAEETVTAAEEAGQPSATEHPAEVAADMISGPGADERRASEAFETVSDYRTEYDAAQDADEWEFGAGLLEDVPARPAETKRRGTEPPSVPPAPPGSQSAIPKPQRSASFKEESPAAPSALPAKPEPTSRPSAAEEEDDFGSGLLEPVVEPADEAFTPARESSQRRRSRPRTEQRETALTSAELEPSDDQEAEDEEQGPNQPRYRNIPTWETAISYLLKTSPQRGRSRPQRQSPAAEGSPAAGSGKKEPSSRTGAQRRSRGGRRRRRRQ